MPRGAIRPTGCDQQGTSFVDIAVLGAKGSVHLNPIDDSENRVSNPVLR
jgi:hypothetical protein